MSELLEIKPCYEKLAFGDLDMILTSHDAQNAFLCLGAQKLTF